MSCWLACALLETREGRHIVQGNQTQGDCGETRRFVIVDEHNFNGNVLSATASDKIGIAKAMLCACRLPNLAEVGVDDEDDANYYIAFALLAPKYGATFRRRLVMHGIVSVAMLAAIAFCTVSDALPIASAALAVAIVICFAAIGTKVLMAPLFDAIDGTKDSIACVVNDDDRYHVGDDGVLAEVAYVLSDDGNDGCVSVNCGTGDEKGKGDGPGR